MSKFEVAGYGVPENSVDAAHMFVDSDDWIRVDEGGPMISQDDLDSGKYTDMVIKDEGGAYHTVDLTMWEGESLDDMMDYYEAWLDSEYE
jgi:hypothetical protein